ncbi:homeobox protein NANOG isoform X1 [Pteropus alecto]|uniref:Homeobox protein NANOGP8 n=1 Tax=Pteropus alecto TaxID=9402 RepID=L5KFW5_PTEAL|nr:homeobox protein NANOG isoform X1 [Pteropus alecto]XP_039730261.1 homeobox protein NANOG isoform X1 [Pteropus giganteus]ELK10430.1 Homeobox protein NANOGP8 [Pteropus alecto]
MSVDPACSQSSPCPEASSSREPSPVPDIYGPEGNYASLQMSSAETLNTETVSPLPSNMDLLIQNSPDSSTSPNIILPTFVENSTVKKEEKVQIKKQKIRTVFSQTQLCVLNERFQRQKYLSLQQMQELSNILNLSYKQIKTWFQNQRMKCKRWQKYNWPKNSNCAMRKGSATTEYPGLSSCHQGCLVNASGNLSMWSNQTCSNPTWSYHSWNSQTWCPQAWNNQAWNNQLYSCGEEALQPQIQFQQNRPVSDLEATLEMAGESYDVIQQIPKYCSVQQTMDLFPNYFMNVQPEDV